MSFAELLTPAGMELLDSLPPYDPARTDELQAELRAAGHSPDLVAAALTQSRLRQAAAAKLGPFASRMLFTDDGLQQATRLTVAARHAGRFRDAGCTHVADLGCGIGADSLALAGLGLDVSAVEQDETTAALATLNLMPFPNARVYHADAVAWVDTEAASSVDGFFADPARRTSTSRVFNPAAYSPPLETVLELRRRAPLGIKVAPGIAHDYLPPDTHAQWISVGGSVVEAGLWFGPLAEGPGRSALVIDDGGASESLHVTDDPRGPVEELEIGEVGRYLIEPDGAVIRAGGVAVLAQQIGATGIAPKIAYLTADTVSSSVMFEAFEVEDVFPYSEKRLREWVRSEGIGILEIKKRGLDISPDRLRKSLKLSGESSATVILTRVGAKHSVIVARRI